MFYRLRGPLIHKEPGIAVVECGGVGFSCQCSTGTLSALPPVGEEAVIYTHLNVRENDIDLFGFADQRELGSFRLLIAVSGVGPRMALSVLSVLSADQLALAVVSGDQKALTACPGVGKKTAERIILELRDKFSNEDVVRGVSDAGIVSPLMEGDNLTEAMSALMALGYTRSEAAKALGKLSGELSVEELIRAALRALSAM